MELSSTDSIRSVSSTSRWISAIVHAQISILLSCELNPPQIRLGSKRIFRPMCTTTQSTPLKTANTTTHRRNSRRSTNLSPHRNHSPFNRLPLEFKTLRLLYSKTASSQRLRRMSTFPLRRASKLMKPSPFLERTLARWPAQTINHPDLTSALLSLDKRTQRRVEWRARHLAQSYLELLCIKCKGIESEQEKIRGNFSESHSLISFLFSIYSLAVFRWKFSVLVDGAIGVFVGAVVLYPA